MSPAEFNPRPGSLYGAVDLGGVAGHVVRVFADVEAQQGQLVRAEGGADGPEGVPEHVAQGQAGDVGVGGRAVDGQVVKIPYAPSGKLMDFAGFRPLRGDAYDIVNREAAR